MLLTVSKYLLIAIALADAILERVARTAVALIVVPADPTDAAVRVTNRLAALISQLIALGAAADLRLGAIVTRVIATAAAADGPAEATAFVQHVAHVALAAAIQIAASILAANGTREDAVPIVIAHKALIAIALAGHTASTVLAAANGPADGDALQASGRVAGAADLDRGQLVGHVCLDEIGQRIFGHSFRTRRKTNSFVKNTFN